LTWHPISIDLKIQTLLGRARHSSVPLLLAAIAEKRIGA
jgi:hypothetical protein